MARTRRHRTARRWRMPLSRVSTRLPRRSAILLWNESRIMANPITIPRLGWNMEQGVFVGWLKADGAPVRAGEPLFTLESEKATEDIEGFDGGILHIPADGPRQGDVVAVIGFLVQPGEAIPTADMASAAPRAGEPLAARTYAPASLGVAKGDPSRRNRPASSPRARRTAANLGIDWKDATGTGRTG